MMTCSALLCVNNVIQSDDIQNIKTTKTSLNILYILQTFIVRSVEIGGRGSLCAVFGKASISYIQYQFDIGVLDI